MAHVEVGAPVEYPTTIVTVRVIVKDSTMVR